MMRNTQQRVRGGGILAKHQIEHFDEWDMEQNRAFQIPAWDPIHSVVKKRVHHVQESPVRHFVGKLVDVLFRG